MVTAVCWVQTYPLPLYFLLITSQRRDDIWQNRNITDHRVTGHKHNDTVMIQHRQGAQLQSYPAM